MYVCICKAITDKQVEEELKRTGNFSDACKRLGLGSDCGVCVENSYKQIQAAAKKQSQTTRTPIKK